MDPIRNKYMKSVVVPNNLSNWRNSCFRLNLKHSVCIWKRSLCCPLNMYSWTDPWCPLKLSMGTHPLQWRTSYVTINITITTYHYSHVFSRNNVGVRNFRKKSSTFLCTLRALELWKKTERAKPNEPKKPEHVALHLGFVRYNPYNPYPAEVSVKTIFQPNALGLFTC